MAVAVLVEEAFGGAVGVGGDEVEGGIVLRAVVERLLDPSVAGGGGAADAVAGIDTLDGAGGGVVELEVTGLAAGPEAVEVGFVPDFEVPPADLVGAVAVGEVADEVVDEVGPLIL